jgi:diacylglycerol O-acyltransferase / wax synthase
MRASFYERLSALDQSFLAFETPNAYMHVAITAVFEPRSLATEQGGVDIERIRRHIAARLALIPRYRQRLMYTPVSSDAIWVDDDRFDLGFHVRHASLPRPGGERQLQRRCAEILERPLDRRRPLWEIWVIEGLSDGRFALLAKVHHCMVDGIAGVDILAALLGTEPCETPETAATWTPRPMPGDRELLRDELRRRARASLDLVRGLREAARAPRQAGRNLGERAGAFMRLLGHLGQAPSTPFNQPIGPHRRVDWLSMELATIKAIRNRLGGTINDVVLTTVAGAVGKFLARRRVTLEGVFRTVVPVSVRAADERGVPGNRVSVWLTTLPVRESDARRRLAAVRAMTLQLKDDNDAMGAELITRAAEWTTANVINLATQFINSARRFNLIVTNVPGPPVPFYLLGAPMVAAYPHLPLFENQGLGVALFSYVGRLYWGVGADWNQMPDLSEFMGDIAESFDELCAAADVPAVVPSASAPAPAPVRRPRLTVHRGAAVTPSAAAAADRDTGGRTRAGSAADDPRRAAPGPRLDTSRSSRSTGQPVGSR